MHSLLDWRNFARRNFKHKNSACSIINYSLYSMFLSLLAALSPTEVAVDTLKNFDIEEAVVVASPKETNQLRKQPLSVSLFDATALKQRDVKDVKGLSAYAPNFFMPDYGSRLTSACYIRGIGSRINTPAVGLYVDNVPYADKSAYDFSFQGIERVDVLRGPQGTLYGRNTMGGLLRIFTADPITHHGTDVSAGIGTGWKTSRSMLRKASFTTYLHPAENMGLSVGGYYEGKDGFFKNTANHKKQDDSEAGGGRLRWAWRPTEVVKLDWTASYEQSNEGACPYYLLGKTNSFAEGFATSKDFDEQTLAQNRPSGYRRRLFNTGLNVEHRLPRLTLSSITAFQHLNDRLFMDQDFTSADIFSLCQKQKMNTVSEEVALKSAPDFNKRWTWTTGVFAMYQYLRTDCPVTFYADGVEYLNNQIANGLPTRPAMNVTFTGNELPFVARLNTPSVNAALFHQSTLTLVDNLTLTLGLRLDYDARKLDLASGTATAAEGVPYHFGMSMGPSMQFNTDLHADPTLNATLRHNNWQVLPKAALNYTLPRGLGNVYVSVAKGYRSGGYNIQSYSDLSQQLLRRNMMLGVKDYSTQTILALPGLPESMKQGIIAKMNGVLDKVVPAEPDANSLYYKPEYTWSYELGIHHNLAEKALQLDLSAFYMKTRDQQIARFAESGMGRVMVNAGRSRSVGVEVGLRSQLCADRLNLAASYGFTNAEFTHYDLGSNTQGEVVDYKGNKVPFVPQHTFSASVDFRQPLHDDFVHAFAFGADVKGAGRIMWNEANTFHQDFYATVGLHAEVELKNNFVVGVWARNLTGTRYATFAFDSMNNRFAQYATPRTMGLDVKWHF